MFYPSFKETAKLSTNYKVIPISRTMNAGKIDPLDVLRKLKAISRHCYLLESREDQKTWGRYSFLGYDPKLEITCINGVVKITSGTVFSIKTDHPGSCIRQIIEENKSPRLKGYPPFAGGLVGYFSYDYIKYGEPTLNLDARDDEHFKDADLMLFDKVIVFDHLKNKIILIANMKTDAPEENYNKAKIELDQMAQIITGETDYMPQPLQLTSPYRTLFDKKSFCSMVEKAKRYIYEGDIFQVVLSNRLEANVKGSLFDTYHILRDTNPSPYLFYFSSDSIEIAGASPETLVKRKDDTLHTFPLAGTKPRGKTPEEDKRLEEELLSDEKELAEHNMLVDLGRNDIGKISEIGSVEVDKYLAIERFSHVMHIGSTVRGTIRKDKDALDAIDAILPAGTLSGAPKIRACEIINKLENNKRGLYGGAIGYIDFTGNLDICIAIRLAFKVNGKVFIRSGAGIVADSIPENEYTECINKAQAVINALNTAQGGISNDSLNR